MCEFEISFDLMDKSHIVKYKNYSNDYEILYHNRLCDYSWINDDLYKWRYEIYFSDEFEDNDISNKYF